MIAQLRPKDNAQCAQHRSCRKVLVKVVKCSVSKKRLNSGVFMEEMTIKRTIEVLKAHNAWRRGEVGKREKMQHPSDIGNAIDVAVRELEEIFGSYEEA